MKSEEFLETFGTSNQGRAATAIDKRRKKREVWTWRLLLCSAFFTGMEIAFVSSNRLLAEMDRDKNGLSQRAIALFYRHPNNFVSTMLVGNNIALVIYGILFVQIFDQTLFSSLNDGARVTADTLLSTLVVLFTGEFLPKTIFKSNPNTMLTVFALPALFLKKRKTLFSFFLFELSSFTILLFFNKIS